MNDINYEQIKEYIHKIFDSISQLVNVEMKPILFTLLEHPGILLSIVILFFISVEKNKGTSDGLLKFFIAIMLFGPVIFSILIMLFIAVLIGKITVFISISILAIFLSIITWIILVTINHMIGNYKERNLKYDKSMNKFERTDYMIKFHSEYRTIQPKITIMSIVLLPPLFYSLIILILSDGNASMITKQIKGSINDKHYLDTSTNPSSASINILYEGYRRYHLPYRMYLVKVSKEGYKDYIKLIAFEEGNRKFHVRLEYDKDYAKSRNLFNDGRY